MNLLTLLVTIHSTYLTLWYLFNTYSSESHSEWFTALNRTWQLVIANVMTSISRMKNDVKGNLQDEYNIDRQPSGQALSDCC